MALKEKILFITGKLAERSLKRVINEMGKLPFDYEIRNLNISVASLLTTQMIERRIGDCLLYTSPSPRDATLSRMPSSA